MKRKEFLQKGGAAFAGITFLPQLFLKPETTDPVYSELEHHKIDKLELIEVEYHWPRFVGKNGRIDFHGQYHKCTALKLMTDKGAMGWGLSNNSAENFFPLIKNKKVSELILPGKGINDELDKSVDFALHDLMGVILNQPVYKLIGQSGTKETPVYSGMIYLDELNPGISDKNINIILQNCEWDYNYGYRQLKVKIGRSGRWYPHEEGLAKDIEVFKTIYNTFKEKNIELLVDSNDMYTLDDSITFLKGIQGMPLFWIEEPFREEIQAGKALRKWMDGNGFKSTFYADGEANPDFDVCLELGKQKLMNVFLPDIYSYGFTKWIQLNPELKKTGMLASPHAWGNRLKTNYIAHIAAGLGNVTTIEGVTCISDDLDYGDYPIINGKLRVSDEPGFGMRLLK